MKKILLVIFSLMSFKAVAAGSFTGKISEIWVNDPVLANIAWIKVDGNIAGLSCSSDNWFALDLTDTSMSHVLSVALTAKTTRGNVTIGGTGTCLVKPGNNSFEYLKYIALQ